MLRRNVLLFCALALMTACTGAASPPPRTDVQITQLEAEDTFAVRVTGLRPSDRVREIVMIAPDGTRTTTGKLSRHRSVTGTKTSPSVGVSAQGGSASGIEPGVTLSFDLFDWTWNEDRTRDLRTVTAKLALPEKADPRDAGWRINVIVVDAAGGEVTYQRRLPRASR